MPGELRVFVHPRDTEITGPGHRFLGAGTRTLRKHFHHQDRPPYHFEGNKKEWSLPAIIKEVHRRMAEHEHDGFRLVVHNSNYDTAPYVIEWLQVEPPATAPVMWLENFVGKSGYQLGAGGPPGLSDCSQAVHNAVLETLKIQLGEQMTAESSGLDEKHFNFFTPSSTMKVQPGDLCWFKYTDRAPHYDHVEFYKGRGVNVGSRPSTNGVGYYHWVYDSYPDSSFKKFGRLAA